MPRVELKLAQWREYMPATRAAAVELAAEGFLEILSRGVVVDASSHKGPVRLRLIAKE